MMSATSSRTSTFSYFHGNPRGFLGMGVHRGAESSVRSFLSRVSRLRRHRQVGVQRRHHTGQTFPLLPPCLFGKSLAQTDRPRTPRRTPRRSLAENRSYTSLLHT